jgi:hypothetical protein
MNLKITLGKYISLAGLCFLAYEYAIHSTDTIFCGFIALLVAYITFDINDSKPRKGLPDDNLICKLIDDLPPASRGIEYLRNGPGSSYSNDDISSFDTFLREWRTPGHKFAKAGLERKKQVFMQALEEFTHKLYNYSYPNQSGNGSYVIKRDDGDYQRQRQEHEELVALISNAFKKYEELMQAVYKLKQKHE